MLKKIKGDKKYDWLFILGMILLIVMLVGALVGLIHSLIAVGHADGE
jgi:hypothetical protein